MYLLEVLAKDQKDIKKEKPKGPNDIVLPPKVHGPVPDKSPSQGLYLIYPKNI